MGVHRQPDVLANWKYDYVGRVGGAYSDINQPWWYYAAVGAGRHAAVDRPAAAWA